jgi:hypothetical protein
MKLKSKTYLQETRKTVACEQHRDLEGKKQFKRKYKIKTAGKYFTAVR